MDDRASTSEPQQLSEASIRRLLLAVHEALDAAIPARGRCRLPFLTLLKHRACIAWASIGRLICNTSTDQLDYVFESDHIPHHLASVAPRAVSSPRERLTVYGQAPVGKAARPRGAR